MSGIVRRLSRSRTQLPLSITAHMGYRFYSRNLDKFYTCDWPIGARSAA